MIPYILSFDNTDKAVPLLLGGDGPIWERGAAGWVRSAAPLVEGF